MPVSTAQKSSEDCHPHQPSGDAAGIDGVLSENARRLRAIVHRWRDQDGDRPTVLPLARRGGDDAAPAEAARLEPSPQPAEPFTSGVGEAVAEASPLSAETGTHTAGVVVAESAAGEAVRHPETPAPARADAAPRLPVGNRPEERSVPTTPAVEAAPDASALEGSTTVASRTTTSPSPIPSQPRGPRNPRTSTAKMAEPPPAQVARAPELTTQVVAATEGKGEPGPLTLPPVHKLSNKGEMWLALVASRRAITAVGWFSCVINVLMLAGPLFMLQVYDRVMTSGSVPTLIALLGLTTAVYAIIGVLELVRSRIITRIGIEIDQRIGDRIFEASLKSSIGANSSPVAALRDLDTLRNFVAGPAPMTFFDVWWAPIYLLVIFATHWLLGLAALGGCAALLLTAYLSDTRSRAPLIEGQKAAVRGMEMAETGQRNAETIAAMGMIGAYRQRWQKINQEALAWQVYASDVLGGISSISKTLRLLLQSIMLAIGAGLALKGEISSGSIIASTIIFGRALAPVEQVITHWRNSLKALDAYKKLEALLLAIPAVERGLKLPAPKGRLKVAQLRVAAPNSKQLILNNIAFAVEPGQMLAVIGPSASGKSSLTKAIVGLWPPFGGSIKLDDVEINRWSSEDLGQHVGYLPQDMELFSGTVRENIARFRPDATDEQVIAAATAAHAHELVMSLPNGYATELGAFGTHLSGGQRQRIALARALFGNPALVVLDEANANLDRDGDLALAAAIDDMRKRGQSIIFVSHRVQAIQQADTLLYLDRGVQKAFGPRAEVMAMINGGTAREGKAKAAQKARGPSVPPPPSQRAQPAAAPAPE